MPRPKQDSLDSRRQASHPGRGKQPPCVKRKKMQKVCSSTQATLIANRPCVDSTQAKGLTLYVAGLAEESEPRTQRISQLAFREDSKTAAVRNFLQREFDSEQADSSSLSLASLINQHRLGRLGGASLFFHVLALASMQSIDVEQHEPYADIMLTLCRENTTA